MRLRLLILAALAALIFSAAPAQAAFNFGAEETLHPLVDVGVVGEAGEALTLGYKTTTQNFLLPYTIVDDGYVLIVKNGDGKYYPINGRELVNWQAAGLMPEPMPAYQIPLLDWIIGHALWPTLLVIAIVYLIPVIRKRRRVAAAAGTAVVPEDKAGQ